MTHEDMTHEDTAHSASEGEGSQQGPFVVGIGASAGGLEALENLFKSMPISSGMAFVIVQHLSPDFKSLMDELLARHTSIPIHRVKDEMLIEPDSIYLLPAKKNMAISNGHLLLTEQDPSGGLNLPIDIFFRSLAHVVGSRSVAIVLSGTGSDGSRGIEDIHEAGGLVLAQDTQTAGFDGMPRSAVATGMVDIVVEPEKMPELLTKYIENPSEFPRISPEVQLPVLPGTELAAIFRLFRSRYGVDFTLYRENTIHRRIERRMQLKHANSLIDYFQLLVESDAEVESLYRDLLVEVTHFFRNAQAFQRLRDEIIPKILRQVSRPDDEIRVWVPGCATGEEAYSIAMLLDDAISQHEDFITPPSVKVFATDVHRSSLEIASAGVYSAEAVASVPEDLRQRYFAHHGSLFHVNRDLRKLVVFAPHDITKDPPFTKVDLISCRNVLIYLEPAVQRRVLALFHFGLKVGGTMMLGPSESVGDLASEFETVDQHWRIFEKLRDVRLPEATTVRLQTPVFNIVRGKTPMTASGYPEGNDYVERTVLEDLLDRYVPPSFLVNQHNELVHSFGDARRLLFQPKGRPTLELLKMVEGDLRMAVSAAMHRVKREKEKVTLEGVRLETPSGEKFARVIAEPYLKKNLELYLVCIEEVEDVVPRKELDPETTEMFRANDEVAQRMMDLERELDFTRESLQTTVEELESSNEELQSTNEELVAANEELQSTNEELHSVNEELYTVNAEHQRKIDELSALTADMDNLMRSTEIGTIFLDRDLRIRRFTPAISPAFNILEQDIGRPIDQFAYHFESPGWLEEAKRVIETGDSYEIELRSKQNETVMLKRMRPYRLDDRSVSGVVITFTDVTAIVKARHEQKYREHLERVLRDLQDFAYAVSHDLHAPTRQVTECVRRLRDWEADRSEPGEFHELLDAMDLRVAHLRNMLDRILEFSRINTRGRQFEWVDLGELVNDVAKEFSGPNLAEVDVAGLPRVYVDRTQIQRVFWHVLDNAIKYSDHPARIHVACEPDENGAYCILFRDNGIGIKAQHLNEIFTMFRRLQVKDNVPGDGVGLALCRRIMERHDGEIWAESHADGTAIVLRFPQPVDSYTQ